MQLQITNKQNQNVIPNFQIIAPHPIKNGTEIASQKNTMDISIISHWRWLFYSNWFVDIMLIVTWQIGQNLRRAAIISMPFVEKLALRRCVDITMLTPSFAHNRGFSSNIGNNVSKSLKILSNTLPQLHAMIGTISSLLPSIIFVAPWFPLPLCQVITRSASRVLLTVVICRMSIIVDWRVAMPLHVVAPGVISRHLL